MTPGQRLSLGQVVALNRRFIQAYLQFKDEPKVKKLSQDVMKYNRILQDLGLQDHQVHRHNLTPKRRPRSYDHILEGTRSTQSRLEDIWSSLLSHAPIGVLGDPRFARRHSQQPDIPDSKGYIDQKSERSVYDASLDNRSILISIVMPEALAASTVKIEGRDVLATWKVLISLGLTPVVYSIYAILATLVMMRAQAPSPWVFWTPIYTLAALPWIAFAALKFGEAGMDVLKYRICISRAHTMLTAVFEGR